MVAATAAELPGVPAAVAVTLLGAAMVASRATAGKMAKDKAVVSGRRPLLYRPSGATTICAVPSGEGCFPLFSSRYTLIGAGDYHLLRFLTLSSGQDGWKDCDLGW